MSQVNAAFVDDWWRLRGDQERRLGNVKDKPVVPGRNYERADRRTEDRPGLRRTVPIPRETERGGSSVRAGGAGVASAGETVASRSDRDADRRRAWRPLAESGDEAARAAGVAEVEAMLDEATGIRPAQPLAHLHPADPVAVLAAGDGATLAAGEVSLLTGHGGVGKSMLALDVAYGVALLKFSGTKRGSVGGGLVGRAGNALFATFEDAPATVAARADRIARARDMIGGGGAPSWPPLYVLDLRTRPCSAGPSRRTSRRRSSPDGTHSDERTTTSGRV